jgi:Flp pilus assembly protein TadG
MSGDGVRALVRRGAAAAKAPVRPELAQFRSDERGVTAVLFGIMFAVLFLMAAMVVDVTRATSEKSREQHAIDAAALAASNYLGVGDDTEQDAAGNTVATRFFQENMGAGSTAQITVDLDQDAGRVTAQSHNDFGTTLIKGVLQDSVRRNSLRVGAESTVVKGSGTIEVAMVLDNSGSMAGTKIADLRTAAGNLVGIVFTGASGTQDVKVGVVPFAASVNVGANFRGSDWIDNDGESPVHFENFSENVTRFTLFDQLGQSWGGCVETRAAGLDVIDTPPTSSNAETLFVPMFAPDEPDDVNAVAGGYSASGSNAAGYENDYISDFGGTCPAPAQKCLVFNKKKNKCTSWGPEPIDVATAQSRTCKYQGAPLTGGVGPNNLCTTPAILELTATKSLVDDAITNLVASGNTNISEGTAWGWRVLSPTAPFEGSKPYSDTENRKVLIVMTDGDNYLESKTQHNKSVYAANGFGSNDRLGTTYTNSGYLTALNTKTLAACSNAKAEGITVYTVAFGTDLSSGSLTLLGQCATSADHAFRATDGTALIQAFQNIGREIAKLRVAS